MTTASSWKRIGVFALGMLVSAFCAQKCVHIDARHSEEQNRKNMRPNKNITSVILEKYHLENPLIKNNLGTWFPNAERVELLCLPSRATFPVEGDTSKRATPCTEVKKLLICKLSIGSPAMFEQLNLLFPGAIELSFDTDGALPVHDPEDAGVCERKDLKMTKVKTLSIYNRERIPGLLFKNLSLFPSVKQLSIYGDTIRSSIEEIQQTDVVLPSVNVLQGHSFPADQTFLSKLPTVFPSLKELEITRSVVEAMTIRKSQEETYLYSFENLTMLTVYSKGGEENLVATGFGERMNKVFPLLSHIELHFPKTNALLPPKNITQLDTVKNVRLWGFLEYPPDFFHDLFPSLDSLIMSRKEFKKLSCGESFFHPHLKHLDISNNGDLDGILGPMEEAFQNGSHEVPHGGLHLPMLESLNIRGSFTRKLPQCFFRGCSDLRTLRMSLDPCRYERERDSWWNFLEPLSKLEDLHLEIPRSKLTLEFYGYGLKDNSVFAGDRLQDIINGLSRDFIEVRQRLNFHATVHFYKGYLHTSELVTSLLPPEKAEYVREEPMDES